MSYQTRLVIKNNIYKLLHENTLVRKNARKMLVDIGTPAIDYLVSFIGHPNKQARMEAIKALSEINDPVAAPFLVNALEDESPDIRFLAAKGLAGMGLKAVYTIFEALIIEPDSPYIREGVHLVLTIIAENDDDLEIKELQSMLDDPNAPDKIVLEGKPYLKKFFQQIRKYES